MYQCLREYSPTDLWWPPLEIVVIVGPCTTLFGRKYPFGTLTNTDRLEPCVLRVTAATVLRAEMITVMIIVVRRGDNMSHRTKQLKQCQLKMNHTISENEIFN